jgi:hypothetical protein
VEALVVQDLLVQVERVVRLDLADLQDQVEALVVQDLLVQVERVVRLDLADLQDQVEALVVQDLLVQVVVQDQAHNIKEHPLIQ